MKQFAIPRPSIQWSSYPESPDIVYHTFTAGGISETVSGSPAYHTVDSTIMETVTATPSGDSECSSPWIDNPTFEDSWPGPWFQSGFVFLGLDFMPDNSIGSVVRLTHESQLEQAIIIPNNREYALRLGYMSFGEDLGPWTVVISLGSYASQTLSLASGSWDETTVNLGRLSGPSDCVPVVFTAR